MRKGWALGLVILLAGCAGQKGLADVPEVAPAPQERGAPQGQSALESSPSELYGKLFEEVQLSGLFPDSKTFADAIARREPSAIIDRYSVLRGRTGFNLRRFVSEEFVTPSRAASGFVSVQGQDVREHIRSLWSVLTRAPDAPDARSSRLPLPYPYVVPGGRFDEVYYWDSYFTMLGLEADGRHASVRDFCRNFVHLVRQYGHVPNGNRTYYLSRSQPPFLSAMMELIATRDGTGVWEEFGPALETEYAFWMDGGDELPVRSAVRRVVRLSDGTLLNRYWDDRNAPRDESYREDIETARRSGRPPPEVYRNLRAAAESGWDFSSRWLSDGARLETIRTIELIPVDLNALLYGVERTLVRAFAETKPDRASRYQELAEARKRAIISHLWDEELGAFADLDWTKEKSTGQLTAATVVPLFTLAATREQAARTAETIERRLLAPHGLLTTVVQSGEQWDAPNGWAPLVWMATSGLQSYGHQALARELEIRWVERNEQRYRSSGKLVEKYDVVSELGTAGGGEYPLQDGFGWTNGVLAAFLSRASSDGGAVLPVGALSRGTH